jgi:hypothetical protein
MRGPGAPCPIAYDTSPFNHRDLPWWASIPVLGWATALFVVAPLLLEVIMDRVARAGGPQDPQDRHGCWVLVGVGLLCVAAGWAIDVVRITDDPVATVDAQFNCVDLGRSRTCFASWEYDGRTYGRRVPTWSGEGPRQIEISAADPRVMITGTDTPIGRYSVVVVAPVALGGSVRWLRRSIALTRRLRRAARGAGG